MSWDVMLFNTRGQKPPPLDQLRETDIAPLGPAPEVRERLSNLLPGIDWSDPTWGTYQGPGFSMEFNVGNDETLRSLMLHIRGGGDAIAAIVAIARPLAWSVLDCSRGEFLDLDNPSPAGWEQFQAFRDQVLKQVEDPGNA